MAKLVTKFKYLKPGKKKKGGYARYIATREGVEKIDDSQKNELRVANKHFKMLNIINYKCEN